MRLHLFALVGCCLPLSLCLSAHGQTSSKASSSHPREAGDCRRSSRTTSFTSTSTYGSELSLMYVGMMLSLRSWSITAR